MKPEQLKLYLRRDDNACQWIEYDWIKSVPPPMDEGLTVNHLWARNVCYRTVRRPSPAGAVLFPDPIERAFA